MRSLAIVVPLAATLIGDAIMGFYHWQVMAVVYAALTLPAVAGMLAHHLRALRGLSISIFVAYTQ